MLCRQSALRNTCSEIRCCKSTVTTIDRQQSRAETVWLLNGMTTFETVSSGNLGYIAWTISTDKRSASEVRNDVFLDNCQFPKGFLKCSQEQRNFQELKSKETWKCWSAGVSTDYSNNTKCGIRKRHHDETTSEEATVLSGEEKFKIEMFFSYYWHRHMCRTGETNICIWWFEL